MRLYNVLNDISAIFRLSITLKFGEEHYRNIDKKNRQYMMKFRENMILVD